MEEETTIKLMIEILQSSGLSMNISPTYVLAFQKANSFKRLRVILTDQPEVLSAIVSDKNVLDYYCAIGQKQIDQIREIMADTRRKYEAARGKNDELLALVKNLEQEKESFEIACDESDLIIAEMEEDARNAPTEEERDEILNDRASRIDSTTRLMEIISGLIKSIERINGFLDRGATAARSQPEAVSRSLQGYSEFVIGMEEDIAWLRALAEDTSVKN